MRPVGVAVGHVGPAVAVGTAPTGGVDLVSAGNKRSPKATSVPTTVAIPTIATPADDFQNEPLLLIPTKSVLHIAHAMKAVGGVSVPAAQGQALLPFSWVTDMIV